MSEYQLRKDGPVVLIEVSKAGRRMRGVKRFLQVFPIVCVGLGVLFGIDWIGRRHEIGLEIYAGVVVGVAALIALASSIGKALRTELWAFDPNEEVVAFETSLPWGGVISHSVGFEDVEKIRYDADSGATILVVQGVEEVVARNGTIEFALAIKELFDQNKVEFLET